MLIKLILLTAALLSGVTARAADAPDTTTWVRFSAFDYAGKAAVTPPPGHYANPIISGFYPDPSACRVGDDYYLVNSSFQYFPGLPVWHSRDLVHWTQIGNVIDRASQYRMNGGPVSAGLYAPTLRYHDGTFYVVCTLVGGVGNFYVTATNPAGPWSDPVVLPNTGGIDPSLFFDDDGKCYITNCDEPVGKPQYTGHRTIRLQELDLGAGNTVGEQTVLVDGGTDIRQKPVWCEGPHLYKVDGRYYLMCAQGGTGPDHSEVIFRSDTLRGPYVPWEKNPVLTARDLPPNRPDPVTCAGHADLVQTAAGDWFAVFLACRPYESGFYNTGRQTFLLPVTWADGWPTILPPKAPVPLTPPSPALPIAMPPAVASTGGVHFADAFDGDRLAFRWVGLRAPASRWFATDASAKALFLEPRADTLSGRGNPSYLAVRQQNDAYRCTVTLAARSGTVDCTAGVCAFQSEEHFYAIAVKAVAGRLTEIALQRSAPHAAGSAAATPPERLASHALAADTTTIDLRIEGDGPKTRFFYKTRDSDFVPLGGDVPSSFLSTDTAGGFQGVTLGLFAQK